MKMSASHEKSPTELILRQHPSSRSSNTFSFCVWVPVCATLACWQVSIWDQKCSGSTPHWSLSGGPNIQPIRRGHLTGTQAEGKWIPQDSHVSLPPQQPPSSGGYNLSEGVVGDGGPKVWCCDLLRLPGCVHWIISETIRRRWWDLRVFFLGCLFHRPVRRKIVKLKTPHTLLVTPWIGLMVNGIEILRFQCGGLPSTSHCLVVHREQVDLIGARWAWFSWGCHHPKGAVRRAQFVRWCLAGYRAVHFLGTSWISPDSSSSSIGGGWSLGGETVRWRGSPSRSSLMGMVRPRANPPSQGDWGLPGPSVLPWRSPRDCWPLHAIPWPPHSASPWCKHLLLILSSSCLSTFSGLGRFQVEMHNLGWRHESCARWGLERVPAKPPSYPMHLSAIGGFCQPDQAWQWSPYHPYWWWVSNNHSPQSWGAWIDESTMWVGVATRHGLWRNTSDKSEAQGVSLSVPHWLSLSATQRTPRW